MGFVQRRHMLMTATVAGLIVLAAGCAPIPYISPPVRGSFQVGPGGGEVRRGPGEPATSRAADTVLGARVAVHPLGMFPELVPRSFDFGLGYVYETLLVPHGHPPDNHGLYAEGEYWFWTQPRERSSVRLGLLAQADMLWAQVTPSGPDMGWGVGAGIGFEYGHFLVTGIRSTPDPSPTYHEDRTGGIHPDVPEKNETKSTEVFGVAFGEIGIGAALTLSYRSIGDQSYWNALFHIRLRLPASVGVVLVPLL